MAGYVIHWLMTLIDSSLSQKQLNKDPVVHEALQWCAIRFCWMMQMRLKKKKKINGLKHKGTMGDKMKPLKPGNLGQAKHQSEQNFISQQDIRNPNLSAYTLKEKQLKAGGRPPGRVS